jgi:hypothetical protein
VLLVGLIPDSEIMRCKGPPVMNEQERYTMVESVKWVDEIITGMPPPGPPVSDLICDRSSACLPFLPVSSYLCSGVPKLPRELRLARLLPHESCPGAAVNVSVRMTHHHHWNQ